MLKNIIDYFSVSLWVFVGIIFFSHTDFQTQQWLFADNTIAQWMTKAELKCLLRCVSNFRKVTTVRL